MRPLGYSSNLHAAETVDEIIAAVQGFTAHARERLGWERLGLDLRLGSRAIAELADPRALTRLREALDRGAIDAYTINAFPLRPFQAAVVKQDAYRPDWTTAERLADTLRLIDIATRLSDSPTVTISTVPGTYRPFGAGGRVPDDIAAALGTWAAAAARAGRATGRTVVLCLEPEPWCLLETSWDVAAFWTGPLAQSGLEACTRALDGDREAALAAISTHLGVCFDTCHVSLAFEDQRAAAARMIAAGARIAKCQVSAAPEVRDPHADAEGVAAMRALAEPRFLHQTAAISATGSCSKVQDLTELDSCLAHLPNATAVRSHFHIPLFREPSPRGLSTTIEDSLAGVSACLAAGCEHVAVETYTWSILAANDRDALAGTVRELEWLDGRLRSKTA